MTVPCIVCGKKLDSVFSGEASENQPSEGTAFQSSGHYGSMFDPMNGSEFIEINVCDECLTDARSNGRVLHVKKKQPAITYDYTTWS
jgi:hypothetical protein